MNAIHTTSAGTVVFEPTADEYAEYLEGVVQDALGMSVAEFRQAYKAGRLDETDATVGDLIALLRVGQADSPSA